VPSILAVHGPADLGRYWDRCDFAGGVILVRRDGENPRNPRRDEGYDRLRVARPAAAANTGKIRACSVRYITFGPVTTIEHQPATFGPQAMDHSTNASPT